MPKFNHSSDLSDYSRSRRYELLKRMRNPSDLIQDRNEWSFSRKRRNQTSHGGGSISSDQEQQLYDTSDEQNENQELAERLEEMEVTEGQNVELENTFQSSREEEHDNGNNVNDNSDDHNEHVDNDNDEDDDRAYDHDEDENDNDNNVNDNSDDHNEHVDDDNEDDDNDDDDDDGDDDDENDDRAHDHDEVDSDGEESYYENDEPIYDGAPISLAESMLSTYIFALSNNLTGLALANLLNLISLHMPPSSKYKKTVYTFMKYFKDMHIPLKKHFYCSVCNAPLPTENSACECGTENTEKFYFIEIPIEDQLQQLLLRPGFVDDLSHPYNRRKHNNEAIEDIYDGQIYIEHAQTNNPEKNPYDLSFMWHTDGAPVFKSRKYSIWPFYLTVNELPYSKRTMKENVIVSGIWFGPSNPNVNLYLRPLYDQLQTLHDGVELRIPGSNVSKKVTAHLINGTCDSPARAEFLNHMQFNGYYGCLRCLIPGYTLRGENTRGNVHIYPFEGGHRPIHLRSHEQHKQHAELAVRENSPQCGVKGLSILNYIVPDIIRGTSVDVMHCVYLGVVRKVLELWLDKSYRYEPFSLYSNRDIVDSRLLEIKPPHFIQRMPRSFSANFKHLKASELKTWFYFYSIPIVVDLLKTEYVNQYSQLVLGIFILNQSSITVAQLEQSKYLLVAFISKFQYLYGPQYMSFNIHSLQHLPEVVEDLGPLWATSCFPFEDLIGKTVKLVHGTRYVGLQIYTKVVHNMVVTNMLQKLNENSDIKNLCTQLLTTGRRIDVTKKIAEDIFALGKISYHSDTIPNELVDSLLNIGIDPADNIFNIFTFKRLKKGNQNVYTRNYNRKTKFLSHCILINTPNGPEIGYAELFVKICKCECDTDICNIKCNNETGYYVLFQKLIVETVFQVPMSMSIEKEKHNECDWLSIPYMYKLKRTDTDLRLINIESISTVCFVFKIGTETYLGKPCNQIEYDQ